jgi:hypothetical protein
MSTLAEISDTLKKSNATMESVNALLMQMLNEDKAAREDEQTKNNRDRLLAEEEKKERKRQSNAATGPRGLMSGLRQGVMEASGLGLIGAWGDRVAAALFSGASLAAVTGTIGRMIGRGAIFGGVAALVGAYGDDLIRSLFDQVAPGVDPATATTIAESISSNASTGLLAAMIPGVGVRGGIGVTLGGIIGDGINSYLGEEENQRVIMNVLGQEITSEDAVRTTMQAAGAAAMLAGPMVGIVAALAGLGFVAGTRLQEWIESKRTAAIDAIETELNARLESGEFGETAGAATLGSTIANAIGLNIQDEEDKSVDALITDINNLITQTRRSQQAAAGEVSEFSGMEGSGTTTFGAGEIDLSTLDPERRAAIERSGAMFDEAFLQVRDQMGSWTAQSLRNFRVTAEGLGRQDVVDYIDTLLNRPRERPVYESPELSISDFEGIIVPDIQPTTSRERPSLDRAPEMPVVRPEALLQRAVDLEQLTADTEAFIRGATTRPAPVIVNNVDNSSVTSGSATIRYDNRMSPYDTDMYLRRGLVPAEIM